MKLNLNLDDLAHVCMVSAEPLANYLPIVKPTLQRPARAHLIVSKPMKLKAEALAFALKSLGVEAQQHDLDGGLGYAELKAWMTTLRDRLAETETARSLVINATGGTKLMSLALIETFRGDERARIIYTDTARQRIECLSKPDDHQPLGQVLDVEQALKPHGIALTKTESTLRQATEAMQARAALTRALAETPLPNEFLPKLNEAMARIREAVRQRQHYPAHMALKNFQEAWVPWLERFQNHKLLRFALGESPRCNLTVPSAEVQRYCGGGWLEEYALLEVCALDVAPHDFAANLNIRHRLQHGRVSNEFDLAIVHNNQLMLVECKTVRNGARSDSISDALYKIETLRHALGGPFAQSVLLSAEPLEERQRLRAEQLGTTVFSGTTELPRFRAHVLRWMEGRR